MSDELIAIVGASCRFPGAPDLESFWQLLVSGIDAVTEVDETRWSTRFYYHPNQDELGKSYSWSAGLLTGVDLFEPAFFGISPREAAQMDPQQRLLLELVWHALEDAGIPTGKLAGTATGVYVGGATTDYRDLHFGDPASGDSYFMTGGTLSILANRISYVFDLHGPSLTIDTACSSSLVALNEACDALRGGRIAGAIVGGVNLLLAPYPFLGFSRASMLSRRGRCFAFDERADGYVRGEGGGVVVLKRLKDALADGDPIRAVIRGTGVNSDGRTIGLSMPSEPAQAALIRAVCERAGTLADDLAFFEMHGTGTPAGDPVEAAAVGHSLGQSRQKSLPIGSVKTNIGHLEAASGMAGLIKTALALERGILPPSLNCDTPNPRIPFDVLNLRIARGIEAIDEGKCAGINSFGFGGTNGHAVLAPPPQRARNDDAAEHSLPPLVVSARSEAALRELARRWQERLAGAPAERAPRLLRAAARGRDHHPQRLVVLGADPAETVARLGDFVAGDEHAVVAGSALRDGKLAFVFSGNGAQWPGMARGAYRANAAFRDAIGEADAALRAGLGWSVAALIDSGVDADRLVHADVAQPLLFAIQIGIVTVLRGLGIEAEGHVGHSVGEIAAAWAAGALSLTEAARVVIARSRNQERTRGDGRMAALALGNDAARGLLDELGSPLEIGAINATHAVTVSGPGAAIDKLGAEARRRGVAFRALGLDFSFHSAAMDAIRDELLADLAGLGSTAPSASLLSTVTGGPVGDGQLGAEYWWHNIRSPVRFTEATAALVKDGFRIFVEIGPNPVLQAYLNDALRAAETQGRVLATLRRKQAEADPFPALVAQCHVAGYDMTGAARFDGPADPRGLPLYPWQRERFWFDRTIEDTRLADPPFEHPLLGYRQAGPVPFWVNHLGPEVLPWLADHAIEGVPVLPAAAVVEMAAAAARAQHPSAAIIELIDVEVRRPLPFDAGRPRELRTMLGSDESDWELNSRPRLSDEPPTSHAVARIVNGGDSAAKMMPIAGTPLRVIDAGELYNIAAGLGLDYGPRFRTVTRVEVLAPDEAQAYLDPAALGEPADPYLIHPALLDGALQAFLALLAGRRTELRDVSFLPWRFGRVRLVAPFGRAARIARLRVTRTGTRSASGDIVLLDDSGALLAELSECWFRRVELSRSGTLDTRALRVDLVPAPLEAMPLPGLFDRIGESLARRAGEAESASRHSSERALLIDAMIASIAYRAVTATTDLDPSFPDTSFTIDALIDAGAIAPETAALFDCLLQVLERFGAAAESETGWRLSGDNDLPDFAEIWRLLLAEAPELVAELALVATAAEELPRLLRDGLRQPEPSPLPMAEHLSHASPGSAAGTDIVRGTLAEIAAAWPADRPLRVLEIGADGAVSRRLVEALAQTGAPLAYCATHPDPEQAARLASALKAQAGVTANCWSLREGDDQLGDSRFDVIVSLQALSRSHIDAEALSRLRRRMMPGGLLLAAEPEPNPLWVLAFGRYRAWWQAEAAGPDGSPLRNGEAWCRELVLAGFATPGSMAIAAGPWPSAALWARAPAAEPPVAAASSASSWASLSLALLGLPVGPGRALGDRLAAAGHRVIALDAAAFTAAAEMDAAAEEPAEAALLVVGEDGDAVAHTAELLPRVARIAAAAALRGVPLWIVTRGAQQSARGTDAGLVGAALWGFGRTLVNEIPRLSLRLIDMPPRLDAAEIANRLLCELNAETADTEIVWTPAGRHVLRLRRGLPARWADAGDRLGLSSERPGGLDALGWKPIPPRELGKGEVAIEVEAAGLNFRDMMWAMGLLPEEALIDGFAGPTFGLECAGIVRAVGPGVEDLAVGDRVAGLAPAALSTDVVTTARAVMRIPADTSFAAAATIPVVFVTAIYALGTLAKLAPGEHVLIHAAAGGVGLAAIQYAKHRGAIVIATAGSEIKREFLRLAGADHVLDSRDLGFADAVRGITDGKGVDVVLNSLSGEAMEQSLGILKPFGRFLELGKRDFYLNSRIHLRALRQNISYFAIDVDQLPIQRPDLARALLDEVSEALAAGTIRPLAHRAFPYAAIEDAFRLMQTSGHIGKIVLLPAANAGLRLPPSTEFALRRDGTYLVTGGLTGFGFAAARWLAEHGAGSIARLGRRGAATPGAEERVAELRALSAAVSVHAGDVADPVTLSAVLAGIRAQHPPLRGVVHAASVIADALVAELDGADLSAILRPKLGGAVALDRLTGDDPIELFLLFSSATTLLGAPGQGAYVAANCALEALARRRRAEGKPALAIAWGPIEDAGYLAERREARDALARRLGAKPIPAAQALSALPAIDESGLAAVGFADTNWSEARRFLPILAAPFFAEVRGDAGAVPSDGSLVERLAELDTEVALALLKTVVAEEAAGILRLPAASIDEFRPLSEMGMDSLMAVELRLALESRLGIELPLMSLAEGTSVASIVKRLAGALSARPQARELIRLAERYEGAGEPEAAIADAAELPEAAEMNSAAAE
jgi:acyl transferase domain-containing protein/NADPH:quinone reductase-like Zn-dependent oxidoreductase/acyl carrier protein